MIPTQLVYGTVVNDFSVKLFGSKEKLQSGLVRETKRFEDLDESKKYITYTIYESGLIPQGNSDIGIGMRKEDIGDLICGLLDNKSDQEVYLIPLEAGN